MARYYRMVKNVPTYNINYESELKRKRQNDTHRLHTLLKSLILLIPNIYGPSAKITDFDSPRTLSLKNIKSFSGYTRLNIKVLAPGKICGYIPINYLKKIAKICLSTESDYVHINILESYVQPISAISELFEQYIPARSVLVKVYPSTSKLNESDMKERTIDLNDLIPKPVVVKNGLNNS